jgi:hypothetical protein
MISESPRCDSVGRAGESQGRYANVLDPLNQARKQGWQERRRSASFGSSGRRSIFDTTPVGEVEATVKLTGGATVFAGHSFKAWDGST